MKVEKIYCDLMFGLRISDRSFWITNPEQQVKVKCRNRHVTDNDNP
ncbi:hypothetical protein ACFSJU_07720 [Paradesertivirga mongoliensis]|uniref:Uncharacterized protein n=1 Tax=Paradesertivirga mongoliensis TaxID=2100740 RepID=A0ABW4ZL59_9SPHI|nr:hypothetical protein [Pedobacter mongoliensis]